MSGSADAEDAGPAKRLKITIVPPRKGKDADADDADNVPESDGEDSDEESFQEKDWTDLKAKKDHSSRPLYVGKNRHIFVEKYSPFFRYIEDFIIAIAEPVSRCEYMHEYEMTQHSLHAAVSIGLSTDDILKKLEMLCKTKLPSDVERFIRSCTDVYGKVIHLAIAHLLEHGCVLLLFLLLSLWIKAVKTVPFNPTNRSRW